MKNLIPLDWQQVLEAEFLKDYFTSLSNAVSQAYQGDKAIFPQKEELFQAFSKCPVNDIKVVIIGQDPYPTAGHANGLCFSINADVQPFAKSLVNVFKEIEQDLAIPFPANGDLTRWAEQGVLLLNSILTVEEGSPQSHKGVGWEKFTDAVIQQIVETKENVVFLLWGAYAHKKGKSIDTTKHLVLKSGHPSPLSANQGKWFGNKHFSKTNSYLKEAGRKPIQW